MNIKSEIASAVRDGALAAVPSTAMDKTDVSVVTSAVVKEVAPLIEHATNNEPWYQSRVTWGVIVAALFTIAKPFVGTLAIDESQTADIVNALATAGQGVGFALTLYGRWKARKPIGA